MMVNSIEIGDYEDFCVNGDILQVVNKVWVCVNSTTFSFNVYNVTINQTINQTLYETNKIYLNLSGTNANQNIDVSPYSVKAGNITADKAATSELHTTQINSSIPDGNFTFTFGNGRKLHIRANSTTIFLDTE